MASIVKSLSTKIDGQGYSQILFRISINKYNKVRIKTNIFIPPKRWDDSKQKINYAKTIGQERVELSTKETSLKDIESKVLKLCELYPGDLITSDWLNNTLVLCKELAVSEINSNTIEALLDKQKNPTKYSSKSFFQLFDEYLTDSNKAAISTKNYLVLKRALYRYELFIQQSANKRFILDVRTMDADILTDFESYIRNEHELYKDYSYIFNKFPACIDSRRKNREPQPRGNNTVVLLMKKLRSFFSWLVHKDYINNTPYKKYKIGSEIYGTPYYITLDERDIIANYDLSDNPALDVQRDIFIFQCNIGCRVSDLLRLTYDNIIDGELQYIAGKTISDNPTVVTVPLNKRALNLIEKYKGSTKNNLLFPFITSQRYNDHIKEFFTLIGINRMVTILNPTTGEEEQHPINEVASSHMARRTFVGNLYKKIKDPNLICPMSGHKVGSAAFARYREIDKDIRKEVISLLD